MKDICMLMNEVGNEVPEKVKETCPGMKDTSNIQGYCRKI